VKEYFEDIIDSSCGILLIFVFVTCTSFGVLL